MRARAALAVLGALSLAFALPPRMASAQSALLPLIERLPSGAQRPEGVDAGPVLEGDAVVWSTVLGGHFSVRRELPGAGVPETLGSVSPSILSLEASSSQVLITAEDSCVSLEEAVGSESCSRKTAVLHADAGERLQKLAIEPFDEPSISGEWLGYSGEGGYEVRDPLNPEVAPTTLQLTGSPERGGLGYPYLATSVSSGHLQVIDTLTGKLAYTVNAHDYDSFEGIEDDGTILLAGSDEALPAWFSAAEPYPHALAALDRAQQAHIADGLVAASIPEAYEPYERERLRVASLAGTVVAEAPVDEQTGAFAFDGSELAWASQPCAITYISIWDLAEGPPAAPESRCAGVTLAVPKPVRRGRDLELKVSCPASAAATGCPGSVTADARRIGRRLPGAESYAHLGTRRYLLLAGESRVLEIHMSRASRRFLAARPVTVDFRAVAERTLGESRKAATGLATSNAHVVLAPPRRVGGD